jgi:hypothetical protein
MRELTAFPDDATEGMVSAGSSLDSTRVVFVRGPIGGPGTVEVAPTRGGRARVLARGGSYAFPTFVGGDTVAYVEHAPTGDVVWAIRIADGTRTRLWPADAKGLAPQ